MSGTVGEHGEVVHHVHQRSPVPRPAPPRRWAQVFADRRLRTTSTTSRTSGARSAAYVLPMLPVAPKRGPSMLVARSMDWRVRRRGAPPRPCPP
jgi:hypothetical protein